VPERGDVQAVNRFTNQVVVTHDDQAEDRRMGHNCRLCGDRVGFFSLSSSSLRHQDDSAHVQHFSGPYVLRWTVRTITLAGLGRKDFCSGPAP